MSDLSRRLAKKWGGPLPNRYSVQWILPVNNPVENVRLIRQPGELLFEVPINYPNCEQLGLAQLLDAVAESEVVRTIPTP